MLRTILCLLVAVTTAQELRRSRQLDLGPDTSNNRITNTNNSPISPRFSNFQQGGYLPPIEPAGAQNNPVILSTTSTTTSTTTTTTTTQPPPPLHPFYGRKFLEPSKDLAPPLNDLEDVIPRATPASTTTTTTKAPFRPEASNDVRNYLPPERIDPAAASPDITVIKPDEEHHHHPHHHGRDLCTDPFHSFLCAPLKARKRITGDLPNTLRGQATFLTPKKVLPDPEVSPQPSNEIERGYLPPSVAPQPSNVDRVFVPLSTQPPSTTTTRSPPTTRPPPTTRAPTTTTQRPIPTIRFRPEPSNQIGLAYLPPSTTRRPTTTFRPFSFQPAPSNEIQTAYLPPTTTTRRPPPPPTTTRRPPPPPTTTRRPPPLEVQPSNEIDRAYLPPTTTTTTRRPPPPPPLQVQPSNEIDRAYLPPINPQPSNNDPVIIPAAASADPVVLTPNHDHDHEHHHGSHGFKDICSDPFHSFLCTSPKPRKRITGDVPDRLRQFLSPAPSNIDETKIRVPQKKTPIPIPKDNIAPAPSQNSAIAVAQPNQIKNSYIYPKPQNPLSLPAESKDDPTYFSPSPSPSTFGYNYPRPVVELKLPSGVNTVIGTIPTTVRPTTPRPTTPRPSTTQRISTTGYFYEPPANKLKLPSESKPVVGYNYPKPKVEFPTPNKGYNYPKPEVKFPLPTEISNVAQQANNFQFKSNNIPNTLSNTIPNTFTDTISNRINLPSSISEAKQRIQEKKITNISSQSGSADFIPVNQVEFPSDGELGVRFGQRLKRRERPAGLIFRF